MVTKINKLSENTCLNPQLFINLRKNGNNMKHFITAIILLCCSMNIQAQDPNFYIYIAIGQSNMVGQAPLTAEDSVVSERFLNLTASDCDTHPTGQWRKAVPPLARQWTKLGPTDYFGRTMLENLPKDKKVGILLVAVDGCAIDMFHPEHSATWCAKNLPDWQRNEINCYAGKPFERLMTLARQAQKDGVIKGIILHQGETDAYNETWLQKVKEIYEYLLKELNLKAEDCPIIAGEPVAAEFKGVCAHSIPTIQKLPQWIPTSAVVSSKGCPPLFDNLHFNHEGYVKLGKRYAYAMLKFMGINVKDETTGTKTVSQNAEFEVNGTFMKSPDYHGDVLLITSEKPYKTIEVVSYSGQTICTYDSKKKDAKSFMLPMKGITDKTLVIVVHASDGTSTTKQIKL